MSEPTNEELRQACKRLCGKFYDVSLINESDLSRVLDFALSRLDWDAEAERQLKVAWDASIEEHVKTERERCAKIAEQTPIIHSFNVVRRLHTEDNAWATQQVIAAKIRSGE